MPETYTTIDEYIALQPANLQERLRQMRETIHKAAPQATEKISWQMPTFYLNGNLVHFAAAKAHMGFYPGADGIAAFQSKFEEMGLKYSKGAVQFPNAQPLPLELVREITEYRARQNAAE